MITFNKNVEPLTTSKPTIDLLLQQERPADLIALYTFYYYTAKWQNTETVRCTTGYTANALKWSEERVQRNKQTLLNLGLIENKKTFDNNGKITGHYIQLYLIWTKEDAEKASNRVCAIPRISQGVEMEGGNAYKDFSSLNAYIPPFPPVRKTPLRSIPNHRISPSEKIARCLQRFVNKHYPNDKITEAKVKSWIHHIDMIFKLDWKGTSEQLIDMLRIYYDKFDRTNKMHVVIRSGETLRKKLPQLERFVELYGNKQKPNLEPPPTRRSRMINDPNELDNRTIHNEDYLSTIPGCRRR